MVQRLITYKALNGLAPSYLSDLVKFYASESNLRSSSQNFLAVPLSEMKSYGDRAFSVCAPKLWNDFPLACRRFCPSNCVRLMLHLSFEYTLLIIVIVNLLI